MSWIRIDDNALLHRKLNNIGAEAIAAWIASLSAAAHIETDGVLSESEVWPYWSVSTGRGRRALRGAIDRLEAAGLIRFEPENGEKTEKKHRDNSEINSAKGNREGRVFVIHDYCDYQFSGEQKRQRKQADRERQRRKRERDRQQVSRRDNGDCHGVSHGHPEPDPDPNLPLVSCGKPGRVEVECVSGILEADTLQALRCCEGGSASEFHDAVVVALQSIGYEVAREHLTEDRGDGRRGRIDVAATRGDRQIFLELDNRSPRQKSLIKLASVAHLGSTAVVLRDAGPPRVTTSAPWKPDHHPLEAPLSWRSIWNALTLHCDGFGVSYPTARQQTHLDGYVENLRHTAPDEQAAKQHVSDEIAGFCAALDQGLEVRRNTLGLFLTRLGSWHQEAST